MFLRSRAGAKQARVSGVALTGHVQAVHKGKIDPTCPACRELQKEARK
jgi:hypothetical protein